MTDKPKRPWWQYEQMVGVGWWGGMLGGFSGLFVGRMAFSSPWAILATINVGGLLGVIGGMMIGRKLPPPR
jgi:hypothetical protein